MDRFSVLVVTHNPSCLRLPARYGEERRADPHVVGGAAVHMRGTLTLAAAYWPEAVVPDLRPAPLAAQRHGAPGVRAVVTPPAAAYSAEADPCIARDRPPTDRIPPLPDLPSDDTSPPCEPQRLA